MMVLLSWVSSVLKSSLCTFANIQNVPAELQERYEANFIGEYKAYY